MQAHASLAPRAVFKISLKTVAGFPPLLSESSYITAHVLCASLKWFTPTRGHVTVDIAEVGSPALLAVIKMSSKFVVALPALLSESSHRIVHDADVGAEVGVCVGVDVGADVGTNAG